MPSGPLGLPRLTSLGPLTEIPVDLDDLVIRTTERKPQRGPGWGELQFLATEGVLDINPLAQRPATLNVKQVTISSDTDVPYFFVEDDNDSILPQLEFGAGTFALGSVQYAWRIKSVMTNNDTLFGPTVAYSRKVDVVSQARRLGIATELKKIMEDDLRNKGIDIVYVLTTSESGFGLNRSLNYDIDEELTDAYFNSKFMGEAKKDKPNVRWMKKEL